MKHNCHLFVMSFLKFSMVLKWHIRYDQQVKLVIRKLRSIILPENRVMKCNVLMLLFSNRLFVTFLWWPFLFCLFVECTYLTCSNICGLQLNQVTGQLWVSQILVLEHLTLHCKSYQLSAANWIPVRDNRHPKDFTAAESTIVTSALWCSVCALAVTRQEAKLQLHQFRVFVQQYLQGNSSIFFSLLCFCLFKKTAAAPA